MGSNLNIQRLLVIVAMDVEQQAIVKTLGPYDDILISKALGLKALLFKKNGKELLLVNSGIGIVNAGVSTALVADKFKLDAVLLFGVAGAVKPGLKIGQLVLASQIIQHDSVYSENELVQLMAPGAPFVSVQAHERENPIFETDSELRSWFKQVIVDYPKVQYTEGVLLSGSEFVGCPTRKNQIANINKNALAVEMESAGIAVVVKKLRLPFAALKTIADRLNPDNSISHDYNKFLQAAAENAGDVMNAVWKSWTHED